MTGEEFAQEYNCLDFDAIRREVDSQDWEEFWMEDNQECRGVFLGTIMALSPSGKVYYPYACSNVEACEACQEAFDYQPLNEDCDCKGEPCEVWKDGAWRQYVERELEKRGLCLEFGEGDPCDLFASEYRDIGQN